MSVSGIGSSVTTYAATAAGSASAAPDVVGGGGLAFPGQAAYPGAAMAQPGSGKDILKKMIIGGVAGGGIGAGYGLAAGMVTFLPHVTIPMGAAIGAAAGAGMGLLKGLLDRRKTNQQLAMMPQPQQPVIQPGAGMSPPALPAAVRSGKVHGVGSSGSNVKFTQKGLKQLGLYSGAVTGKLDEKTATSIRRYEIIKGALPTGTSTPDLRAALHQDIQVARQFK